MLVGETTSEERQAAEEAAAAEQALAARRIGEEARLRILDWRHFVHDAKQKGWNPKEKVPKWTYGTWEVLKEAVAVCQELCPGYAVPAPNMDPTILDPYLDADKFPPVFNGLPEKRPPSAMPEGPNAEEIKQRRLAKQEESNWQQSIEPLKSDLQGVADDDRMASTQVRR